LSKRRRRTREKQIRHAAAASSGLAVAGTLVSGSVAMAATYQVDTTADSSLTGCTTADNDCSLRGAITDANADPNSTITFASTVTGSIVLGGALPTVSAGETIQGPGARVLSIDGADAVQVFAVDTGAGAVQISGLRVTNGGGAGLGGIGTQGANPLTVSGVTVAANRGRGITATSPLAIDASTISGNGRGNSSGPKYAGVSGASGISASAGLTMTNSTVALNSAKYGIGIDLTGGGTIENSTITQNGGTNSGFGGIRSTGGALILRSSIVAGNLGPDVTIAGGGTLTENYSLIQNVTTPPTLEPGSDHNLNGMNPLLGLLRSYGGPTDTVRPSASSPVIDQGKDYVGSGYDQRGVALFDNAGIANAADGRDMGAVELRPASVSSLAPDHGRVGDTVVITGTRFTGATAVNFGGTAATSFTVDSDTQITATAPGGHNGAVDVTVTTPEGTSVTTATDQFTFPDPATYVVDTTSDDASLAGCSDAPGDCSLRGAIAQANGDPNSTITFAPSVTGSITLGSALPDLKEGETIKGPGADVLTIDGNNAQQAFSVAAGGGAVSISGLTVANGSGAGGAITSQSASPPLTLSKMAVSGNAGKGVVAAGQIAIDDSTISGNGGYGVQTNAVPLTMTNSTVSGNATGLVLSSDGTIENSTISANSAPHGGIYATGGGAISLQSTIVAGNTGTDVQQSGGGTLTENYSLIQNDTVLPTLDPSSDHNFNGQDPALGALAGNGGPTKTMKPSPSSPVVDQGKDSAATGRDQRGAALFDNAAIANASDGRDIGALELGTPSVSSLSPDHGTAGDKVTIAGTNFTGASAVKFGAADATSFKVDDDGHITAVAPAGDGTVDVTVTTQDMPATSATSDADKFTYDKPAPAPEPQPTPTPVPPPRPGPKHLTDAQVLRLLRRPVLSATFVTKPRTLVFTDRLPEAGKTRFELVLLKRRGRDKQSALGHTTVVARGSGKVTVTINLRYRGWQILRAHPEGRLRLFTSFRRDFNHHLVKVERATSPKNRPRG
jgi:hypothetical protein